MRRTLTLALALALSLGACTQLQQPVVAPLQACVSALVANPAVRDAQSALAVALATPPCQVLAAELLQQAIAAAASQKK